MDYNYSGFSDDPHFMMKYIIALDQFTQFFKDQRLPDIEQRLKSYKGNQAKLKYLKKMYEEDFSHLEEFNGKLNQEKNP